MRGIERAVRLLTYNVHGCRGTDGIVSPARIAEVIAHYEPDIVALQELDVARLRSGGVDQATEIAKILQMTAHFHPAMHVMEEKYGDAILTAWPSRMIRGAGLPGLGWYRRLEPRGALLAEIETPEGMLRIVNTHLGLLPQEQRAQAHALLGPDWIGGCADPIVLMGDFNFLPDTAAYRALTRRLRDVQRCLLLRRCATFPARRPVLRIDHVFVSAGVEVRHVEAGQRQPARIASDHLPLIVDIAMTA